MSVFRRRILTVLPFLAIFFSGCGGFKGVVTPTLSAISPASVAAGSAAFTLTATGTNFTSGTQILWDGVAQTTTVVSNTQLTAAISAAQIAVAGTVSIRVMKADTTTSSAMPLTITGGTGTGSFSLTSISPSSVAAGSAAFTITATGTGFVAGDVITLNNTGIATNFDSATQLHATVPASSVAAAGVINVGVLTAANVASNQLPLTVTGQSTGTPPTLTSLSPSSASTELATGAPLALAATGTGFVSGSQIIWNGAALPTQFVSSTQLTATVPAADLVAAIPVNVFVLNPDSTASNFLPFTITATSSTVPTLTSISPTGVAVESANGPNLNMTLIGTNFAQGAFVDFGSTPLSANWVSSTKLTTVIPVADLQKIALVNVGVSNSPGVSSNTLPFRVGITQYFGVVNDLVWDPTRSLIYISISGSSGAKYSPNTVRAIDPLNPLTNHGIYSPPMGSEPNRLAISDDGKYLYVGLDGQNTVERLLLPSLTPDPTIPTGIPLGGATGHGLYLALDLQVAPGQSHVLAVARGKNASSGTIQAQGGIAVYDDAVQRPSVVSPTNQKGDVLINTIQWGADATVLYAAGNENNSGDLYELSVSNTLPNSGVTLVTDSPGIFPTPNLRIHFDRGNGLLYGDDGLVYNPALATQVGNFLSTGIMVPDSTIGDAYFVGQAAASAGTLNYLAQSFNLTSFIPGTTIPLSPLQGVPQHLIRWGTNGLAFNTKTVVGCTVKPCAGTGLLYILNGPYVTTVP